MKRALIPILILVTVITSTIILFETVSIQKEERITLNLEDK